MVDGAGHAQSSGVAVERTFFTRDGSPYMRLRAMAFRESWQPGNLPGKPEPNRRLIETDQLPAQVTEGIRRCKQNEPANAIRMARRQHHGDSAAVRVSGDIGLARAESVHEGGDAVGGSFKARIEPGNALRLPHIEEIDGVNSRVACEEADILPPVSCRTDQSMQQKERATVAGTLVVDLLPIHEHKSFFDICLL